MTKTVHLKIEDHKVLKAYCTLHKLTILEVLGALIQYIETNQILPMDFLDKKEGNVFSAEENILREIRKNRNTYVSFQRTFEKRHKKDVFALKEFSFFILQKIIATSVKGSLQEDKTINIIQFLLMLTVEEDIVDYNIEIELVPELYKKIATQIFNSGNYYMTDIDIQAKRIIEEFGILPETARTMK